MEYIEIKNSIIIGRYCGEMSKNCSKKIERIEMFSTIPQEGEDVRMYTNLQKGIKKPLTQLVKDGFVKVPKGKKVNKAGTDFEDMNEVEKVKAGLIKLEKTQKIDGDFIVQKTQEELFSEGLISEGKYNSYIADMRKLAYSKEADPLGMQVLRGDVDKQVWLDKIEEIKNRYPKASVEKK